MPEVSIQLYNTVLVCKTQIYPKLPHVLFLKEPLNVPRGQNCWSAYSQSQGDFQEELDYVGWVHCVVHK